MSTADCELFDFVNLPLDRSGMSVKSTGIKKRTSSNIDESSKYHRRNKLSNKNIRCGAIDAPINRQENVKQMLEAFTSRTGRQVRLLNALTFRKVDRVG
ncbi:hypothetical protein OH492_25835 [Vibrio chagasii]|nr:hypothetical protein [Vibrio chagasii]